MRVALLMVLLLWGPGCYSLHAAGGQLGVLVGREPIEDVLEAEDVDPKVRSKLELVLDVRRYAMDTIGLERSGSYTDYYDTGGDPIVWNVTACAADSFTPYSWWFPVVGTLPYVGYFDVDMAVAEGRRLSAEGLDALVLPVPAFSTLGWFDDPVFSSMLEGDDVELASTVIHEIAHATVWIDGDAAFNENLASFVGRQGAEDYFRARGGEDDPALARAREAKENSRIFNEEILALRDELVGVYEACGTRSAKIAYKKLAVARFRARFREEIQGRLSDDSFDWVLDERVPLNNALLLTVARYHGVEELFARIHAACGGDLAATVRLLVRLAEADDPRAAIEAYAERAE